MKDVAGDLEVFGKKFEGWFKEAQNVGRWFPQIEGAGVFIRKWRKDEEEATAERHKTVETPTLTGGCLLYTSPSPRD